jgi:hypothetical protein
MEDWTNRSDQQVFTGVGELPGSAASYWRDIEIRRRDFLLNQELLRTQIASAQAQKAATDVMKRQATILVWTAGFAALSAVASLATAVVTYLVAK